MTVAHFCKEVGWLTVDYKLKAIKKCEIAVEIELQKAELCVSFTLLHASFEIGTVPTQPSNGSCLAKVNFKRQMREGSGEHI